MGNFRFTLFVLLAVVTCLFAADISEAEEVGQGFFKVTIVTPGTVARLCPYPNCGENKHITHIPENTVLEVEDIARIKSGMLFVRWFRVNFKGKRGWVSVYDTDLDW